MAVQKFRNLTPSEDIIRRVRALNPDYAKTLLCESDVAKRITMFWRKRVELLKTTGDLTEEEYQKVFQLATGVGWGHGQIRQDLNLSQYDMYLQLGGQPEWMQSLRQCWITGMFPLGISYTGFLMDKDFPETGNQEEEHIDWLIKHHQQAGKETTNEDDIAKFEDWKKAVEYLASY